MAAALAAGDSCRAATVARRLQQRTILAINEHRVTPALEEQLTSAVNALVARVKCIQPPAPATTPAPPADEHGHGRHKGHEKKHGKHKEND